MKSWLNILIITCLLSVLPLLIHAQEKENNSVFLVPMCIYQGDTIPHIQLRDVYIYKPMVFKNEKERKEYNRLVHNVKKTLPLSKEVYNIVLETYEFLQTLPTEEAKEKHIKKVEKGVKQQYTPKMKKLTFSQGKLLIKLIDRQCNQSSYELIKAFIGPFKAGFYQTFAGLFGASLRKQYDPQGEDKLTERIIVLIENGQL